MPASENGPVADTGRLPRGTRGKRLTKRAEQKVQAGKAKCATPARKPKSHPFEVKIRYPQGTDQPPNKIDETKQNPKLSPKFRPIAHKKLLTTRGR